MAEETKKVETVVVPDVPVAEKPAAVAVVEKEPPPQPEPEPEPEPVTVAEAPEKPAEEAVSAVAEAEKAGVTESASFKEESNKVEDLPNPEKKALDELKLLVQEALNKHEFTPLPPPPPKEEEKKEEAPAVEEKKESEAPPEAEAAKEEPAKAEEKKEEEVTPPPAEPETKPVVVEDTPAPVVAAPSEAAVIVEKIEAKIETVEDDGSKTLEEIKETIVEVTSPAPPPPAAEEPAPAAEEKPKEEEKPAEEATPPPPPPEEVSIWGIPLLADEKSDVILLKFLRARDFKVKEAFAMLKSVVGWRKEFKIDELLEEELGQGLEKVVFLHGVDKENHPVCYNAFGEFQNKELYQTTFADKEKLDKFLKWRIQFMEKSIRNLEFSPDGICTFVQVIDLKNSPGLYFFKKELRLATNKAFQLLQDNYPEFVAKQVFINVPWWYPAYYKMINGLFTTRTKSKFVFAGPSRSAETLLKYVAPEQLPVQYGGLSKDGEQDFTQGDAATEENIKPSTKHTIEIPVSEKTTLTWEARVIGWDVTYGAEFVPSAEGAYTVIVQKSRKVVPTDEPVISGNFKIGEPGKVVLTFDNQTSKRKKLLYRSKTKPCEV